MMAAMSDWERLLLTHAEDHIETLPEPGRREALELIAARRCRIGTAVVDDESDENWGTTYVLDLLPDDGRVLRVA